MILLLLSQAVAQISMLEVESIGSVDYLAMHDSMLTYDDDFARG